MSSYVETRIKKSSQAFKDYVWPIIKTSIGGGEIIPVEGIFNDDTANKLDMISGIDIWQIVNNDKGIRGIANRIQPQGKSWDTFTIRRSLNSGQETEYHKRIRAIMNPELGYLYPQLTIQAYTNSEYTLPVYSVGIIRTKDLFNAVVSHLTEWDIKTVSGGNTMFVLGWDRLLKLGYKVKIYKEEDCHF